MSRAQGRASGRCNPRDYVGFLAGASKVLLAFANIGPLLIGAILWARERVQLQLLLLLIGEDRAFHALDGSSRAVDARNLKLFASALVVRHKEFFHLVEQ